MSGSDSTRPDDGGWESVLAMAAEEFTDRVNRGEQPDVEEFAQRHPAHADRLRTLLLSLQSLRGMAQAPPCPERVGDYRIVREIGRGGMGVVYEATQVPTGRRVALKVLPGHLVGDPAHAERFRREARAAGRLHHANIVLVFEAGTADGVAYYAMQFIDGHDPRRGPRDPASVARVGVQAAEALHHAHGQGVLHRDVKPSNILVDAEGRVWITDFGLAKLSDATDLTGSGDVLGTLRYLAPEQLEGRADARSDLYSLGLALYELATGRPAFDADDHRELLKQVLHADPPRPRLVNALVPRDLETVLLKATAREPAARYQTGAALAADLRRFLSGEAPLARRIGPLGRLARWARRHPLVAVPTALAAALLVAVTAVSVSAYRVTSAALGDAQEARVDEALALRLAKQRLYVTSILQAQAAFDDGELPRLRDLLAGAAPGADDDVGWEWHWLRSALRRRLHRSVPVKANDLAVAPDGKIAVAATDGTVRIWDGAEKEVRSLRHAAKSVRHVAWRPDGTRLASIGQDGALRVWDAASGAEVFSVTASANANLRWSRDGLLLAVGLRGEVRVLSADDGSGKATLPHNPGDGPPSVDWSPDGKTLATAAGGAARLWDMSGWKPRVTLPCQECLGVQASAWSPDGQLYAVAGLAPLVKVFDGDGREVALLREHAGGLRALAWAPDQPAGPPRLAVGGFGGTVYVWDVEAGRRLWQGRPERNTLVTGLAWLKGGTLVSACAPSGVHFWDVTASAEHRVVAQHDSSADSLAWHPDGRRLLSLGSDHSLICRDLNDPERSGWRRESPTGGVGPLAYAVAWHGPTRRIVTASATGQITVLDDADRRIVQTIPGHQGGTRTVAFSPDGGRLLTGGAEGNIRLWRFGTAEPLTLAAKEKSVEAVAWSTDGSWLAAGTSGGAVRLWQADGTAGPKLTTKGPAAESVAFDPTGGRLASAHADGALRVWRVTDGALLLKAEGHGASAVAVGWSPDGRRLASASQDRTVKVWDAELGLELLTLRGFPSEARAVAWSPDGRRIAAGGRDGTVRVWDAGPAE